jgi:hypothetical protein
MSTSTPVLDTAWTSCVKASVAALVCAVCACLTTPAIAAARDHPRATRADAAATRAYLRASDTYERSATAELATRVTAMQARANEIAGECPSALTYAPRDEAFGELGEEASTTVYWAGAASVRSTELRLADAIAHLRWSNRRLTRLVHAEAAEEHAIATIALPDVCADIAAWKASAYATLPQSSTKFVARMRAIEFLSFVGFTEASRETIIMRLLRRFERPAERRAAKRIERLEAQINKRLGAAAVAAQAKLAAALGVAAL